MHDDLKRRLRDEVDAELGTRPQSDLPEVLRRGRGKRLGNRLMATVTIVLVGTAVVAGGLWIGRTISSPSEDGRSSIQPADETQQEIEQYPEIEQDPEIKQESLTRQVAIISRMADAVNARDTDAFIDIFAHDGEFHPPGGRVGAPPQSVFTDGQPIADAELARAWMAINDAWDLKAEVMACGRMTGPIRRSSDSTDVFVECKVRARWHKLSLEVVEGWNFEFDGTELLRWGLSKPMTLTDILDLNPPNRSLPLGYDGLLAWEEWLEANHPEAAARYLNPRAEGPPDDCVSGCQEAWDEAGELAPLLLFGPEKEWSINGYEFRPSGYIPYDPAYADEIQVSIQEYLDDK